MRYIFVSLAIGLSVPLPGCMSDNYGYVSDFQPNYYNDYGLKFGYATGPQGHHLRYLREHEFRR
ncbi:hypothetical protein [Aminobacter sp. MET-1]|uniref:hypothetical protein n=1 Tax=Aminobacter sp. MET-1 TaxID=2951085 RepID=UPI00226997D0|nr:hypothetical protein [Aminobacter sp. MET-1]MCX8572445.1 hypothetical protein [Aminobacter sp. MET-1]